MLDTLRFVVVDTTRELKSRPALPAIVVLALALAIGMNVGIFGLVDRALLAPPPHLDHPDRLFTLAFAAPGQSRGQIGMTTTSYVVYRTIRDEVPALAGAAAWRTGPPSVVINGEQVSAVTKLVSDNYFELLGTTPRMGPGIHPDDQRKGTAAAVLSHTFWNSAYRGDPAILGRRMTVDGIDYTIAGVMPRGFSGHSAAATDVWLPIGVAMRGDPGWDQRPQNIVSILTRVRDNENLASATDQASAVLTRDVTFQSLAGQGISPSTQRIAYWLTGVSLLVLVIGLANAATLMLVRAARRRHEYALRATLGAARRHLFMQIGLEAIVIGAAATIASLVTGQWFEEGVRRILLPDVAQGSGLQSRIQLAAGGAGVVSAIVVLLAGMRSLSSDSGVAALKSDVGGGRARVQRTLLVIQTAVCVALLSGAGMFAMSLHRLTSQDFGFRMQDVLLVDFEPGVMEGGTRSELLASALQPIRALPGVRSATVFQSLPFEGHHVPPISVPGRAEPPNMGGQLPYLIAATPELFEILEIKVIDGRRFMPNDDPHRFVAVVNESMAQVTWPGERAVGKCIRAGFDPGWDPETATGPPTPSAALPCREVIGVVRDVRQRQVVPTGNEARLLQYYVPLSQVPGPPAHIPVPAGPAFRGLLVRTSSNADGLPIAIRRLVVGGRDHLPFVRVHPYADLLNRQTEPWRLGSRLLTIFSALALGVATIGIFATFAHAVTLRRREMAIRIAIGAAPPAVVTMILGDAARLAAVGIVAGCIGAFAGGQSLQSVLYGIVPMDPVSLGGATLVMLTAVLAATIVPARRASKADPNLLLRAE